METHSIFGSGLEPPKYSSLKDFLDPDALGIEQQELTRTGKRLGSGLDGSISISDPKMARQWDEIGPKSKEIYNTRLHMKRIIEAGTLGNTVLGRDILFALDAAEKFTSFNYLEKQKKIADESGFLLPMKDFFDWAQFAISAETTLKIGGVSIEDVMKNKNLSPAAFFKQQIEAQIMKSRLTHGNMLEENRHNSFIARFPNVAKAKIQEAAGEIIALWTMASLDRNVSNIFMLILRKAAPLGKELALNAETMLEKVRMLRTGLYETLFAPHSPGFKELKRIASEYLFQPDEEIRMRAIYSLGIGGIRKENNVPNAYRKAKKMGQETDENADFYRRLAQLITMFVEKSPLKQELLTKDDIVVFLDETKELPQEPIPIVEDLRKINGQIFLKAQKKEYEVNPQEINWANLIPPQEIKVQFSEGGPRKFSVILHYKNPEGEMSDISLAFNTKRGEFDWPFLEDTNDPEMREMKDALMFATKEILINAQKQAEYKYQEKQKLKTPKLQTPPTTSPNGNKPKSEIPYVRREREKKTGKQKPPTPIEDILTSEIFIPEERRIRSNIVLPTEDKLKNMMVSISPENQKMIATKIDEFNQKGIGTFKLISPVMHERKRVYELRSGKFRVLVTEVQNGNGDKGNGIHKFEIFEISHRRETFRKKFRGRLAH